MLMSKHPALILFLFFLAPLPVQACRHLDHLVVTEVQIAGEQSSQDYLRIYNPTLKAINVSGYRLRKRSCQGKDYSVKVFPKGTIIPSKKFLTWANAQNNFAALIQADCSSKATLSANNSVALLDRKGNLIDSVSWGAPQKHFGQGKPFPSNPKARQVLRRKQDDDCFLDSDNDSVDFYLDQDLTSSSIADNLTLERPISRSSSKWLIVGFGGAFSLLAMVIILLNKKLKV